MTTEFSFEVRVLMCVYCGASLDADINGGAFDCDYCGATNHIVPRQTAEPSGSGQLDEEIRMSRLWAQVGIHGRFWRAQSKRSSSPTISTSSRPF